MECNQCSEIYGGRTKLGECTIKPHMPKPISFNKRMGMSKKRSMNLPLMIGRLGSMIKTKMKKLKSKMKKLKTKTKKLKSRMKLMRRLKLRTKLTIMTKTIQSRVHCVAIFSLFTLCYMFHYHCTVALFNVHA